MNITRATLTLVVSKSIIFNQLNFCQCHIIQYPNICQNTQDWLLKSNIVNNILDFSVQKLHNVTRVTLELTQIFLLDFWNFFNFAKPLTGLIRQRRANIESRQFQIPRTHL